MTLPFLFGTGLTSRIVERGMTQGQKDARSEFFETIRSQGVEEFSCPICSANPSESFEIGRVDRHNIPLSTVICLQCGCPRSRHVLASDSLEFFYSNIYRRLYHDSDGPDESFFQDQFTRGQRLVRILKQFVEPGARVLEIGCGAGGIVSAFLKHGYKPTGIDFDPDYLEFGKSRGLDLRSTALKDWDEDVDVVVLSHVLEHLTDPREFLDTVKSVLKPNGIVLIEVPNIFALSRTYGGSLRAYLQYAHVFHYDRWSLLQITQSAGFNCLYDDSLTIGVYQNQIPGARNLAGLSQLKRLWRVGSIISYLLASRVLSFLLLPTLKIAQALVRHRRGSR